MAFGPFSAKDHLEIASLGMEIALAEILGVAGGHWLDIKFGTYPWCLLGGALVGFAIGMIRILQVAKSANKKENKDGRN